MAKAKTPESDKTAPPKAQADESAPAAGGKKKRKLLPVALAAVLAFALAGGGAWFVLRSADAPPGAHREEKARPDVFVGLDTFTVNLQPESGDHYLQTTLTLKVTDNSIQDALKLKMPEVRSRLLLLLSSKAPSELSTVEGKRKLAQQIADEVNLTLDPDAAANKTDPAGAVLSVFFTSFIIQ
jgi:flagellar FliL protein